MSVRIIPWRAGLAKVRLKLSQDVTDVISGGVAMIVVMNRIPVTSGRELEFERTFTDRDRAVDQMPGFVDLQVLRPAEGRTYVVMTRWKSREAFDHWTQSEAFITAHRSRSPGFADDRPTLEIYDVMTE